MTNTQEAPADEHNRVNFHRVQALRKVAQTRFMCAVNLAIAVDFPANLPMTVHAILSPGVEALSAGKELSPTDADAQILRDLLSTVSVDAGDIVKTAKLAKTTAHLMSMSLEQALLSYFSTIDALINDVMKVVYVAKPVSMRSKRQFSADDVIAAGGWSALLTTLADACVYELGMKPLVDRLAFLRKQHGLELDLPEPVEKVLSLAEKVRNIFVHSGGLITSEFVRATGGVGSGKEGHYYVLDKDMVLGVSYATESLISTFGLRVNRHFFGLRKAPVDSASEP